MANNSGDEIDLAERGIKPLQTTDTESTLQGTPGPQTSTEDHDEEATGRTGSARLKQSSMEMRFFPACERQLFMVLDYLAAKSWNTHQELEELERRNWQANRKDYMEHQPNNDYGKLKGVLMDKLTEQVRTYFDMFYKAHSVLGLQSPDTQYIKGYRLWASYHLSKDPSDDDLAADNYRFIGPRPSGIDNSLHSFLKVVSRVSPSRATRSRDEHGIVIVEHSNTLFRAVSHLVIISFALVFLLLPIILVYLIDMSKYVTVAMMVTFCLCFCLVIFLFTSVSYHHKFALVFAYTAVLVTLLSIIGNGSSPGVAPH